MARKQFRLPKGPYVLVLVKGDQTLHQDVVAALADSHPMAEITYSNLSAFALARNLLPPSESKEQERPKSAGKAAKAEKEMPKGEIKGETAQQQVVKVKPLPVPPHILILRRKVTWEEALELLEKGKFIRHEQSSGLATMIMLRKDVVSIGVELRDEKFFLVTLPMDEFYVWWGRFKAEGEDNMRSQAIAVQKAQSGTRQVNREEFETHFYTEPEGKGNAEELLPPKPTKCAVTQMHNFGTITKLAELMVVKGYDYIRIESRSKTAVVIVQRVGKEVRIATSHDVTKDAITAYLPYDEFLPTAASHHVRKNAARAEAVDLVNSLGATNMTPEQLAKFVYMGDCPPAGGSK